LVSLNSLTQFYRKEFNHFSKEIPTEKPKKVNDKLENLYLHFTSHQLGPPQTIKTVLDLLNISKRAMGATVNDTLFMGGNQAWNEETKTFLDTRSSAFLYMSDSSMLKYLSRDALKEMAKNFGNRNPPQTQLVSPNFGLIQFLSTSIFKCNWCF
jgi:hypothetical protein